VHADVFPDNVFFNEEKISGVIDFYFACTDTHIYDLMLTLNAWAFDATGTPDLEKIKAMLKAYEEVKPLSLDERAALLLFGRAAALRISATRLYDLLHPKEGAVVTPKNPLAHANILRFYSVAENLS
jgi:homoserine kinase type II